jgi:hypothetical protein
MQDAVANLSANRNTLRVEKANRDRLFDIWALVLLGILTILAAARPILV